jgi:hypothetical protein
MPNPCRELVLGAVDKVCDVTHALGLHACNTRGHASSMQSGQGHAARHSTPGNMHAPHQATHERHSGAERAMQA